MSSYYDNEDAGDCAAMNAADASEYFDGEERCPNCGAILVYVDDVECDECGYVLGEDEA